MTVRSVTIQNYRAIKSLTLPLHPQLTVLHGANGSGKTSILTAIALALAPDVHYDARRIELDLHAGGTGLPTIQLGYGEAMCVRVRGIDDEPGGLGWAWGHVRPGKEQAVGMGRGGPAVPHMFYDTDREVVSSLTERYVGTRANYEELFDWFYAKENEELRLQRERNDFDACDSELSSVRDAICGMLNGASNPHIDMRGDGPPRFSVTLDRDGVARQLSLEQLSGGYQNMLAVAADIAWRLGKYQRTRTRRAGDRGAVALIDEVELHLHPEWQQRVLDDLMRTFPSVQFVVTTHSPQVLTTVHPEHIVELAVEDGDIVAGGPAAPTYGAASGDVLSAVMGVDERPPNDFTSKLRTYMRLVDDGKGETEEALELRRSLEEISFHDPALQRADMAIRRHKMLRDMGSS